MRVTIVRTGGFAGLRRQWSAAVDPDESEWHDLLGRIPWDETKLQRLEPDRYVYIVTFVPRTRRVPERRWEIPEQRFTGPWLELLERVQALPDPEEDE